MLNFKSYVKYAERPNFLAIFYIKKNVQICI